MSPVLVSASSATILSLTPAADSTLPKISVRSEFIIESSVDSVMPLLYVPFVTTIVAILSAEPQAVVSASLSAFWIALPSALFL